MIAEQKEHSADILSFPSPPENPYQELKAKEAMEKDNRKKKLRKRIYAFGTDLFLIGVTQKVIVLSYISFINENFNQAPMHVKNSLLGNLGELRLSTLVFTFFSYFLLSYFLGHGKTPGKTLFNLRVFSHEGDPKELSFMEAFMRTVGYTTCYITGSFLFLIAIFRKDMRGLPDFFSQTEVYTDEEFDELINELKLKEAEKDAFTKIPIDQNSKQLDLFAS